MGAGASAAKLDLSIVENLEDEFRKHGDIAVRRAWELTATQISSDADMEMHLAQLRRLAGTLTKDKSSIEKKERRIWLKRQIIAIDKCIKRSSGQLRKRRSCFLDAKTPLARSLKMNAIVEVDEDRISASSPKNAIVPDSSTGTDMDTSCGDTSCSDAEYSSGRSGSSLKNRKKNVVRGRSRSGGRGRVHRAKKREASSARNVSSSSKLDEDAPFYDTDDDGCYSDRPPWSSECGCRPDSEGRRRSKTMGEIASDNDERPDSCEGHRKRMLTK